MKSYVILLRGINVGGKNKVSMSALRQHLEDAGFKNVATYIASGNVLLDSDKSPKEIKAEIETALLKNFKLDSVFIKALVISQSQIEAVINNKPKGFGEQPDVYHSDVIFLMGIDSDEAMKAFSPREGVDMVWPGHGVIYFQRLSALRTKSRLNSIIGTPAYKCMTVRTWGTNVRLLSLLNLRKTTV